MTYNPDPSLADSTTGNTLRAAIIGANADSTDDVVNIVLGAGTYSLSLGQLEISNTTAMVNLLGTGTSGAGASVITIADGSTSRVFQVDAGTTVLLRNVAITHGQSDLGGAIFTSGDLTLDSALIDGNEALGGAGTDGGSTGVPGVGMPGLDGGEGGPARGGGIYVAGGSVALKNSTLSNDIAQGGVGGAGGVGGNGASGISGNINGGPGGRGGNGGIGGDGDGGGIYVAAGASVTLEASTISNVTARGGTGGPAGAGGQGGQGFSVFGKVGDGGDGGGGGHGGPGGFAGRGLGGGIYLENGAGLTLTTTTVSNATAQGGAGGSGGAGGAGGLRGHSFGRSSRDGENGDGGNGRFGALGEGGGLFDQAAGVVASNSTLFNDTAQGGAGGNGGIGGGVFSSPGSNGSNGNSTAGGIALLQGGSITLTNCTVSGNAAGLGGGLTVEGAATLTNTIVAGNGGGDILGVYSGSNNLVGGNPLLAPLGNYGGPTQTLALLPGSPAIDGGTSAGAPTTDQRGVSRLGPVDIGAFESRGFKLSVVSGDNQTTRVDTAFANPLVVAVASPFDEPVVGGVVSYAGPGAGAGIAPNPSTATIAVGGQASLTARANTIAGASAYKVTASVGAGSSVNFRLTNTPGDPASVSVVSGAGQSARVNTAFPAPLVVEVRDQFLNLVPGASVTFAGPSPGASAAFTGSPATTGPDGRASVTARANTTAGAYTVTASAGTATPASFALTNTPDDPASVLVISGSGQSARVNTAFGDPLVVVVKDQFDNLVPGASVTFAGPTSGASILTGSPAITGSDGQASVTARANTTAGAYSVTASVGTATPASFALTNTPGDPASVTVVSGSGQSARVNTAFGDPLVVVVRDQFLNLVPGASVTFAGPSPGASAAFTDSPATTGPDGQASVTARASTTAGAYTVTARVDSVDTPASFALINTPGDPASVSLVSGSGQSATIGAAFAAPLVVVVKDTYGNPVPGATVTFAAPTSGASATLSGSMVTTGADGQASVTATANAIGGSYTVTASVDGVATSATFNLTNAYQIVALFDQTTPNHSGSTVPITIKLTDAQGHNVGSSGLPLTAVSVVGPSGSVPLQSPGNSQPGNLFTFDPNTKTYQFNLKTTGYTRGTYTLYFRVGDDPTLHSVSFRIG
jgi:hypothetical protein